MKNYTLILLLAAMILFGCKQQTENSDSASLTNVTHYTPSKSNHEIADSIMLNAYRKGAMWDTFWDDAAYNEIYDEVRREAGMFGFFYQNGLPYCVFSKEEWSSMTDVQRIVATRIAHQRYKARRLVKSFFMNYYGEITRFCEHYSVTDDGVTVSYNLTVQKHDEVDTEFSLKTFVIDLQAPRFKYYSTMRERNPDPKNYQGLMERGAQPMYYGKWIDCNINDSFFDIATLVMHVKKILDPKLMQELDFCLK